MKMNREDIMAVIPHRDPMLLVDTVEEIEPGVHITTTFHVDADREIFKGHFPSEPVLPGVYSVECMAQFFQRYAQRIFSFCPLSVTLEKFLCFWELIMSAFCVR